MQGQGGAFSVPTGSTKKIISTPVRTIDVTKTITLFDKLLLNNPQLVEPYNHLKTLRYRSTVGAGVPGALIFDLPNGAGNEVLYNLLYKIKEYLLTGNTAQLKVFLELYINEKWTSEDQLFYALDEFEVSKYKLDKLIESYHDKMEVQMGLYTCKKCKSKETVSSERQTRSRDEGETVRVVCLACGDSWRIR